LSPAQIQWLEKFRRSPHEGAPHGYTLPLLRTAMGASFGWETLKKALAGRPVLELHHAYIAQWIARYLEPPAVRSGKDAASGERDEPEGEDAAPVGDAGGRSAYQEAGDESDTKKGEPTGTLRGSR
jgi:hypothetical protein